MRLFRLGLCFHFRNLVNLGFFIYLFNIVDLFNVLDLFFTPSQKQLVSTLNPAGKVQFLTRWWESMDPDPETGGTRAGGAV